MTMRNCPRCMREKGDSAVCPRCGFDEADVQALPDALPAGTDVGGCTVGMALASNRQAICYAALDSETKETVLLEEFFPSAAVKREGKKVVQVRREAKFRESAKIFAAAGEDGRDASLIRVIRENDTVYRVYALKSSELLSPENAADALLDVPIRFREEDGNPICAINTLPIPPLPEKTVIAEKKAEKKPEKAERRREIIIAVLITLLMLAGIFVIWKLR